MRGGQTKAINELEVLLEKFGTAGQVKSTIQRIKETNNWDDFLYKYPYGTHINPHTIKQIVTNYYNTKDRPTNEPTNEPTFNAYAHNTRVNM